MTGAVLEGGMVIVGAGEAGSRAASSLRDRDFRGRITLIGDEMGPPYERPPLSKSVIASNEGPAAPTPLFHTSDLPDKSIAHISGTVAEFVDKAAKVVRLHDGRAVAYTKLLIATGAASRRLNVPGAAEANVCYLRSYDDALALWAKLKAHTSVLVVGGGLIGLEVASSALARGCSVTVVETASRVLMRGVPAAIAESVAALHRAAGVEILTGVGVEEIRFSGEGQTVSLSNGSVMACDLVVAAIGAVPEVRLARASGLAVDNGIQANRFLQTDDPHIYAAGDCCNFPHPIYGGRKLRLESWRNARQQGEVAAANMMGIETEFTAVPWFWSDQYNHTLQVAGLFDEGLETFERKAPGGRFYFQFDSAGRLMAAGAVGELSAIGRDMRAAELLIEYGATPDPIAICSHKTSMKSLLRQFQPRTLSLND